MNGVAGFTPEELAELAAYDNEVDREQITLEEWAQSSELDRILRDAALDPKERKKREKDRRYYRNNADECKRKSAEWAKANPERNARNQADYRAEHKDEIAARDRAYYAAHRKEKNEASRRYYAENRERITAVRAAKRAENPDAVRERDREYWRKHNAEINAKRRERYAERKKAEQSAIQ